MGKPSTISQEGEANGENLVVHFFFLGVLFKQVYIIFQKILLNRFNFCISVFYRLSENGL